jgi:plastocyanin
MRSTRWVRVVGMATATLLATAGTAQAATLEQAKSKPKKSSPKTYSVTQVNLVFDPDVLKLNPGDKVVWTNEETDDSLHSVVQGNGSEIDSPDIPPKTSFEVTFTEPFAWKIICRFHPDMFMDIDVAGKPNPDAETHAAPSPRNEPKPKAGPLPGLPPLGNVAR